MSKILREELFDDKSENRFYLFHVSNLGVKWTRVTISNSDLIDDYDCFYHGYDENYVEIYRVVLQPVLKKIKVFYAVGGCDNEKTEYSYSFDERILRSVMQ